MATDCPENLSQPEALVLEEVTCPLGCPLGDDLLLVGGDRIHRLPGEFRLLRCRSCGLGRTSPRPTPAAMTAYYPQEYGPHLSTRVNPRPTAPPRWWKTLGKRLLAFNTERLPELAPGRLLEIGCASGGFLQRQQEFGWQVAGIEFSPLAVQNARQAGLDVHCSTLEEAPPPAEPFDLVVGWMVLEHLHDPVEGLRRLHAWTRPGGWLVLSLPHVTPAHFHLFGACWYGLQLPTHLFHFTPATLRALLSREGWRVEKVFHHRLLSCLLGSLGHRLAAAGRQGAITRWLEGFPDRATRLHLLFYPLAWLLAACGQTGRMTVWARRSDA